MSRKFDYNVLKTTIITVLLLFGTFSVVQDTLFNYVPVAILLALCLVGSAVYLKVPAPKDEDVIAIIGQDPNTVQISQENVEVYTTGAHRGAGLDAPENSLVAFKICAEKGINLVEFDVTLTADDVPVVFHDDSLERLTDHAEYVRCMTWERLSQFDISVKHPLGDKFKNTYIPKLDDVVKQLLVSNQKMLIDLKGDNKKIVDVIVKLFADFQELHKSAIVTSFYPQLIYLIRRKDPQIVCALAWRPYCMSTESYNYPDGTGPNRTNVVFKHLCNVMLDVFYEWTLRRILYYLCGISVILLHKDAISGKIILDWRAKGVRVIAWNVNHPLEKQYLSRILKVTYLTDTLVGEATAHLTQ